MTAVKTIDGITLLAEVKEGWRCTPVDKDRLVFVHPDFPPKMVELSSINEGDELPRDTDETVLPPPQLGGN